LLSIRALYAQYVSNDELCGAAGTLADECTRLAHMTQTAEFEAWICRIALGGAGVRARNIPKALQLKHTIYIQAGGDPVKMMHPALWAIAKPLVTQPEQKAAPAKAKAAATKAVVKR
jgi:hypothetical protein